MGLRCNNGQLEVASIFANQLHTSEATFGAAQEICRHQAEFVKSYLQNSWYETWSYLFQKTKDAPGCEYGIAAFYKGIPSSLGGYAYMLPNEPGFEERWVVCVKGSGREICSTHLHSARHSTSDDNLRARQAAKVADMTETAFATGLQVWVGGDFNEQPNHSVLDRMYSNIYLRGEGIHYEAYGCNPTCTRTMWANTTDGNKKYDYIFSVPTVGPAYAYYVSPSPFSDHHMWEGSYYEG